MDHHARKVDLETCFNFRDLGGLVTNGGARIRRGLVYRSDSLQWLTDADGKTLQELSIRTVIDLRSTSEFNAGRHSSHLSAIDIQHLPLFELDAPPFERFVPGDPDPPPGQIYINFASACGEAIADSLRAIVTCEFATIVCCAAGKDRTGVVVTILLAALGVPDTAIIEDYALSDEALRPTLAWAKISAPEVVASLGALPGWLLRAPPIYMSAFLESLRERYGSTTDYLSSIGISDDLLVSLRNRLLED